MSAPVIRRALGASTTPAQPVRQEGGQAASADIGAPMRLTKALEPSTRPAAAGKTEQGS